MVQRDSGTFIEAMALGRPVVVTAVGELTWLIRDRQEGRIVPHGATCRMADVLDELLVDPGQQAQMGKAARHRIEELAPSLDVQSIATNWHKLLAALALTA